MRLKEIQMLSVLLSVILEFRKYPLHDEGLSSDSEAQGSWKSTAELLADLEGSEHFRPVGGREATELTFTRTC